MKTTLLLPIYVSFCLSCFGQENEFQKKFRERNAIPFPVVCDTIKNIWLVEAGLSKFPNDVLLCKNVVALDLSMNHIKEIPNEINQLSNLEHLVIAYSPLKKIPATIGDLSKLKVIWFLDDEISSLPKEISKLKNLEELNLNGNPIKEIPEEFFQLQKLKKLYLGQWNGVSLFTKEEQEYIKKQLPNCEVRF